MQKIKKKKKYLLVVFFWFKGFFDGANFVISVWILLMLNNAKDK